MNVQIGSKIHVLHPPKSKNLTLTREQKSPGKYYHHDLWEGGCPHYEYHQSEVAPDFSQKDIAINILDLLNIFHL